VAPRHLSDSFGGGGGGGCGLERMPTLRSSEQRTASTASWPAAGTMLGRQSQRCRRASSTNSRCNTDRVARTETRDETVHHRCIAQCSSGALPVCADWISVAATAGDRLDRAQTTCKFPAWSLTILAMRIRRRACCVGAHDLPHSRSFSLFPRASHHCTRFLVALVAAVTSHTVLLRKAYHTS